MLSSSTSSWTCTVVSMHWLAIRPHFFRHSMTRLLSRCWGVRRKKLPSAFTEEGLYTHTHPTRMCCFSHSFSISLRLSHTTHTHTNTHTHTHTHTKTHTHPHSLSLTHTHPHSHIPSHTTHLFPFKFPRPEEVCTLCHTATLVRFLQQSGGRHRTIGTQGLVILFSQTGHTFKRPDNESNGCLLSLRVCHILLIEGEGLCVRNIAVAVWCCSHDKIAGCN